GARPALVARLAVLRALAVECLGEDARRRRLAGATRAAEQIRMGDAALAHCIAQRGDDRFLAAHLRETLRAKSAVEGLVGHGEPRLPPLDAAARLDCGTREGPLRAAASRPCL